jgi:hypothetical protein
VAVMMLGYEVSFRRGMRYLQGFKSCSSTHKVRKKMDACGNLFANMVGISLMKASQSPNAACKDSPSVSYQSSPSLLTPGLATHHETTGQGDDQESMNDLEQPESRKELELNVTARSNTTVNHQVPIIFPRKLTSFVRRPTS